MSGEGSHTVVITLIGNEVKLVFDGDEDNYVQYGASDRLADQPELKNVQTSKAVPPKGKNLRALLTCHGGTLEYDHDGVKYKINVNKEPNHPEGENSFRFGSSWIYLNPTWLTINLQFPCFD